MPHQIPSREIRAETGENAGQYPAEYQKGKISEYAGGCGDGKSDGQLSHIVCQSPHASRETQESFR